jgi:hypothetical protein
MSDSIPMQWISQYIINVAETCGKSFADIPIEAISPSKKKRVQILEVRTSTHFLRSVLTAAVFNIQLRCSNMGEGV